VHMQAANCNLFDHLVGGREQHWWHVETESLRGFKVDDQIELGWLHHREVGWVFTLHFIAGRYDEASSWAEMALRQRPT
jgi:hypothetical protein